MSFGQWSECGCGVWYVPRWAAVTLPQAGARSSGARPAAHGPPDQARQGAIQSGGAHLVLRRECQAQALAVRWTMDAAEPLLLGDPSDVGSGLRSLHHLPPPSTRPREPSELADRRDAYAYGRFFYRRGPRSLILKDRRDPSDSARFTLDHPELQAAFHAHHAGRHER
ncbi:DUF5825 family protein [Streptomyces xiamenensis]